MITIYNETLKKEKDRKDDHVIREMIEGFFDEHSYLDFTNILAYIKEVNPPSSRGPGIYECSLEARLPNQEPAYVSKKNENIVIGVKEALDTMKEEILKRRHKVQDRSHGSNPRPF